jgi:hypothetical protein
MFNSKQNPHRSKFGCGDFPTIANIQIITTIFPPLAKGEMIVLGTKQMWIAEKFFTDGRFEMGV